MPTSENKSLLKKSKKTEIITQMGAYSIIMTLFQETRFQISNTSHSGMGAHRMSSPVRNRGGKNNSQPFD